jgi:hypothetical protein
MADEKKFDDLLSKYYSPEEKQGLQEIVQTKEDVPKEQSPSDIMNSHTPDPKDVGKAIAGSENKVADEGLENYNTRQDNEVTKAGHGLGDNGVEPDKEEPAEPSKEGKEGKPNPDVPKDMLAAYRNKQPTPAKEPSKEKIQDDMER